MIARRMIIECKATMTMPKEREIEGEREGESEREIERQMKAQCRLTLSELI